MNISETLDTVDSLKDELDKLRPIPEDRMQRVMQKLRLDWNYHSNSIEGNTLSLTETRAFLLHGQTANGKPFRDHLEMRGHNEVLKKLEQIVHKELRITENLIKEFHKIILVEPYDGEAEINPGEYKKRGNYLYTPEKERLDFEPPEEVPRLMNELINWTNNSLYPEDLNRHTRKKYDDHPLLIAAIFHLRFIRIHPFGDGNGRMARILTNLILMMKGYSPAIVKTSDKVNYYRALNSSSSNDISELAIFLGEQLIWSLNITIDGAQGKSIEELDDVDKEVALLKAQLEKEVGVRFSKSNETICRLWQNSFSNLFERLHDKLLQFDDLFLRKDEKCLVSGGISNRDGDQYNSDINRRFEDLEKIIDRLKPITDPDARRTLEQQLNANKIDNILYHSHWEGFVKDAKNPFDTEASVEIYFDKMKYIVKGVGWSKESFTELSKLYHEIITQDEIDSIVNSVAKKTLENIKLNLNPSLGV